MPIIKDRYSEDWDAIAFQIKTAANWTCQECGRPCRPTGTEWMAFVIRIYEHHPEWYEDTYSMRGHEIVEKRQKFTLTVAHLDQDPQNNQPNNLRALCSTCHLKHDAPHRAGNKYRKREYFGQTKLNL